MNRTSTVEAELDKAFTFVNVFGLRKSDTKLAFCAELYDARLELRQDGMVVAASTKCGCHISLRPDLECEIRTSGSDLGEVVTLTVFVYVD